MESVIHTIQQLRAERNYKQTNLPLLIDEIVREMKEVAGEGGQFF